MKLSKYREDYYYFSGKASDLARQLSFAGIAVIWVFRIGSTQSQIVSHELLWPLGLFVTALALDLLQYLSATVVWGVFQWHEERTVGGLGKDPDLDAPTWLKWPQTLCFVLKLIAVATAYTMLIVIVWNRLTSI